MEYLTSVRAAMSSFVKKYDEQHHELIDEMKLHKLLYFAQRESLVRYGCALFEADFYGWKFGPVCREVRLAYKTNSFTGNPDESGHLSSKAAAVVNYVYDQYGNVNSWDLSLLSHSEYSWKRSRRGLRETDSGKRKIVLTDIAKDADRVRERREVLSV